MRFPSELKAKSEVLAVGRDSAGHQVQIAYAIAGSSLEPVTVTRGYLYSVRLRFVAMDDQGKVVASLDTTRHFVAPEPVPPERASGGARGRDRAVRDPCITGWRIQQGDDAGMTLPRDSVRVGPTSSTALSLSDLVLGSRTANLGWRRTPDDTVLFNPLRTYKRERGDGAVLRDRGTPPGPLYRRARGPEEGVRRRHLQEDLRWWRGGHQAQVRAAGHYTAVSTHRSLKLERLKPGNYVLELLVVDADGRKDCRTQEFQVVEKGSQRDGGKRGSKCRREAVRLISRGTLRRYLPRRVLLCSCCTRCPAVPLSRFPLPRL